MKRIILAVVAVCAIAALPAVGAGKTGSCSVSPDPVAIGADFTLTGTGLTPLGHYYINITGQRDSSNGAHPQTSEQADASGVLIYTRNTNGGPDAVLVVGRAKARIYPQPDYNDASGTANCWFEVR